MLAFLNILTGRSCVALGEVLKNVPLFATLVIAISAFVVVRYIRSPWRKLPPGPTGLSLIRNAHRLTGKQWLVFSEWKKIYGDVVYLNVFGQPFLVLNSHKTTADLLDRRAAIYSDRPHYIVAGDILTGGLFLVFLGYNETWRRLRRAAYSGFHKALAPNYHYPQLAEAILFAKGTLAEPDQWEKHLRRTTASAILSVVYDTPSSESEEDKVATFINNMIKRLARAAVPGAHLVEFMPFLMAVPSRFAGWKRRAEEWFAHDSAAFEGLFNEVRDRIVRGEDRPSFSATLIRDAGRHGLSMRAKAWLAATMFAGGSETTSSVMIWWMLAMVAHPDVQKLAQAELDSVVGRDRLPSFADFEHLPYIRAMVKETLRWRPVAPISLPHRLIQDDWYEGHFIPKGTIVIPNIWQLNRDPEIYGSDAAHFNPARHLGPNACVVPGPADKKEEGHVTFGFGRRICVGRNVGKNTLFINIAMMLWAANIERHLDADGNQTPLDIDGCLDNGIVVLPAPFKSNITPRFPEVVAILEHEKELIGVRL